MTNYLTSKEVRKRLNGCSPATLWRYQQPNQSLFQESLPSPIKSGAGSYSLWDADEFSNWEKNHFQNRHRLG